MEAVRQLLSKLEKHDIEGVIECVAPEVEWQLEGFPRSPLVGVWKGYNGVKKFLALAPKYNSWSLFSTDDIIESKDGHTIIAYGRAKGTVEPNPAGLWRFTITFKLNGTGKIAHVLDSWRVSHEDAETIYGTVYIKGTDWATKQPQLLGGDTRSPAARRMQGL